MKENPSSSPRVYDRNPYVIRADKTRKVIWANFKGNRAEVDLRAKHQSPDLYETVQKPEAALEFLGRIEDFDMNDSSYFMELVLAAVRSGGHQAEYFVKNLGCFALMMDRKGLGDALCAALEVGGRAVRHFLDHESDFGQLNCFDKAKQIAKRRAESAK